MCFWRDILSTRQHHAHFHIMPINELCGSTRYPCRYIQPCPPKWQGHNKLSECYLPSRSEQANTLQSPCHFKFAKRWVNPMGLLITCVMYHNCHSLHFETILIFKWTLCEKVSLEHPTCNVPNGYLGPRYMLLQLINVMHNIERFAKIIYDTPYSRNSFVFDSCYVSF